MLRQPSNQVILSSLLMGICEKIQIPRSKYEQAEERYKAIAAFLSKAKGSEIVQEVLTKIHPHGSLAIDTTIRPLSSEEFDLDVVALMDLEHSKIGNPKALLDELLKIFNESDTYKGMVTPKSRCITIQYKNDFHIDVMPACPEVPPCTDQTKDIRIPNEVTPTIFDWKKSNPSGFSEWFLKKAAEVRHDSVQLMEKSAAEVIPLPTPAKKKKPLQYTVQLLKRARDVYFENDDDRAKIARSIILTTIAAESYNGTADLFESLANAANALDTRTSDYFNLKIKNPVNNEEDFADKWKSDKTRYDKYRKWIAHFKKQLAELQQLDSGLPVLKNKVEEIFGKEVSKEFFDEFGQNFKSSGNNLKTTTTGNILASAGIPVAGHRFFGGDKK